MAALIMDVDGVVSPVKGQTAWGDDVDGGPALGYVPVSPTLNARLDALADRADVTPGWLTSWDTEMRTGMRFPGANWPAIAHANVWSGPPVYDEDAARGRAGERWRDNAWWKWWALDAWLTDNPAIDTLVWCDDHLRQPFFAFNDEYDVERGALTRAAVAALDLEPHHVRALLIAPSVDVGLTPRHVEEIEIFLKDPTHAPERPRMPRELEVPGAGDLAWLASERERRPCARCVPEVWYLRYFAVGLIDCPRCGRTYYGPHDVTAEVPPAIDG